MEKKNKLDKMDLAQVDEKELEQIKDLERKFNEKYYIIALEKEKVS